MELFFWHQFEAPVVQLWGRIFLDCLLIKLSVDRLGPWITIRFRRVGLERATRDLYDRTCFTSVCRSFPKSLLHVDLHPRLMASYGHHTHLKPIMVSYFFWGGRVWHELEWKHLLKPSTFTRTLLRKAWFATLDQGKGKINKYQTTLGCVTL